MNTNFFSRNTILFILISTVLSFNYNPLRLSHLPQNNLNKNNLTIYENYNNDGTFYLDEGEVSWSDIIKR
jgi:hypothetical protein